jgi:hypothetical protein
MFPTLSPIFPDISPPPVPENCSSTVPWEALFDWGAETEGPRKFLNLESAPGLWGRFDRTLLVRKQRFSMPKFTI